MNGAYDLLGVIWHAHSPRLMTKLLELWPDKSRRIVDLGCGLNYYITVFNKAGYKYAFGIDAVDCGSRFAEVHDLTKPLPINQGAPMNVLSLEVGEHIDYEGSLIYLDNIVAVAQGGEVIMSWAVPGQAGHGHINTQTNAWVIEQMESRGYVINPELTLQLREAVRECKCDWFRNTLMYFQKA